ncbi:hypothetical protein GEOBRER4_n0383 [Citrifermentans bremense]|uniref:Uncharacterized protein n=1 Tax=Citrifermentans bremense TaxID=60035 RepID=A0A7R7FRU9_9BACT|nr:hypothetical protein GEOBRER4_n0383 [Citrifermentans bremense]
MLMKNNNKVLLQLPLECDPRDAGVGDAQPDRIRELAPFHSVTTKAVVERYLERLSEEGVRLTAGQTAEVFNELTGSRGATLSMGALGTAKTSLQK